MHTSLADRLARLSFLTVECPITIEWLSAQHQEGVRASPYKGNGRDYCDFRDYQEGDKVTRINWKMLARRPDRPVITLLEEERNACVCLLVDVGSGMDMLSVGLSKRELACVLTTSIIRSAARTNDTVLFASYDERGVKRFFGRRAAHGLTRLAPAAVLEDDSPDYVDSGDSGLACAFQRLPATRSLVFVITDKLELSQKEQEALFYLGVRHEVVFLSVSDLRERLLPQTRLVPFLSVPGFFPVVDQNGNASAIWTTRAARDAHTRRFNEREKAFFSRLSEVHCKHASLHTEDDHDTRRNQLTRILSGRRSCLNLNEGVQA